MLQLAVAKPFFHCQVKPNQESAPQDLYNGLTAKQVNQAKVQKAIETKMNRTGRVSSAAAVMASYKKKLDVNCAGAI